ncbi:hypothetical protein C8J31_11451 [Rhizobium sp. PP-CC-2G-626]|nr:hypothetical protein C8J31_11451 [Rhizobium sp. PP-CC-2G-626]
MKEMVAKCGDVDVNDRLEYAAWLAWVYPKLGTLEDLADVFGVSAATFSRWATGASLPSVYARRIVLDKLAELLQHRITAAERKSA